MISFVPAWSACTSRASLFTLHQPEKRINLADHHDDGRAPLAGHVPCSHSSANARARGNLFTLWASVAVSVLHFSMSNAAGC